MCVDGAVSDAAVGNKIAKSKFFGDSRAISLIEIGIDCHMVSLC